MRAKEESTGDDMKAKETRLYESKEEMRTMKKKRDQMR